MGRNSSIDEATGKRLIEAYGRLKSVRKAAAECGVSKDAAGRFFATLPQQAAPVVASPELPARPERQTLATAAAASLWDTRQALDDNYQRIVALANKLDDGIQVVSTNGRDEYVTYTPVATTVAAIKEIREHVRTGMELMQMLVHVDAVRQFQESVIEAIGEADEETRQRIFAKLRARRALGLALVGP